jgi:hypothetical protein
VPFSPRVRPQARVTWAWQCCPGGVCRVRDIGGGVFDDGPDGYREEFLFAVEVARALHDPAEDWEGFCEALWAHLTRVFGIEESPAVLGAIVSRSAGGG